VEIFQPNGWQKPRGYSHGIAARGRQVFVSGQIGWDAAQQFVGTDFVSQARQALRNIVVILEQAGAKPEHIVRMTWYVVDKREYVAAYAELGVAYREVMGAHYPAATAVQVAGLVEDLARVEIEATAVIPE
jgi:enamine deaminase RidA (YjgF/YER057c/UK114 family)